MWEERPGDGMEEARELERSVMEGRESGPAPESTSPSSPPGDPGKGSPGVRSSATVPSPLVGALLPPRNFPKFSQYCLLCQHLSQFCPPFEVVWVPPLRELAFVIVCYVGL